MSISHKSANTQVFRLMVYRRALHPELFDLQGRQIFRHGDYEAEGWILPAGHVVRYAVGNKTLTETVIEGGDHLPEAGLLHALPCLGEKDFELEATGKASVTGLGYVTTIQTESLTDNLYNTTLREMRTFAEEAGAMYHEWRDSEGTPCLSVLDTQKYKREFHIQSYHLTGSAGLVLRTQSIFEYR